MCGLNSCLVTVVILTYNEEVHIQRALDNVKGWATDVFVLDSFSTDRTGILAEASGAHVFLHPFENYAAQREWALRELPYQTDWVLFLDADELLSESLKREIFEILPASERIAGFYIKRQFWWMGRWIRYGGIYPTWILRLVRHRRAHCNARIVNEHLAVDGPTKKLACDLIHNDLNMVSAWIAKHNRYADLEAFELLRAQQQPGSDSMARLWGTQAERKRWIRQHIWNSLLPPLLRPLLLFLYRYLLRLGFLDGREGLIYHVLQGLWFPFLIDVKFLEKKRQIRPDTYV